MNTAYTGKKISMLRKEKGMTQKELAAKLQVTDKAVSKWERGLNYPDLSLFQPLAVILETSVSELLGIEQDIPNAAINIMVDISNHEKCQILKKIRDYLGLTICLSVATIVYKLYLSTYGYAWEKYNSQFWIEGILIALSATLVTNGIYFLIKYKKFFSSGIGK